MERRGRLYLRHKKAQYVVLGEAIAICRKCGLANDHPPTRTAPAAASGPSPPVP
ncbi:MAG: hypothetical protein HUU06_01335 [Planctomycetaceae bacterium]|nr:hypothetical protein [Planctomycetota bacterium]NUN51416.1 hypothetical protein [Planctomycetaceae bacterium]